MKAGRSALYSSLVLLLSASCQPLAAEPHGPRPAPELADRGAVRERSSRAKVSGISFEPLVYVARGFVGDCPGFYASSAGVYSITALGEDTGRFQLRLHAKQPVETTVEGLSWLKGAAHPRRPELILAGGYTGTPPAWLRPGAPARGLFLVALDPSGRQLWQRVVEIESRPMLGVLLLADGSVIGWGNDEVSPLFSSVPGGAGVRPTFLSRVDGNGAVKAFEWYREREDLLSLEPADAGALYEVVRDPRSKVLLRRRDEKQNRIVSSTELPYGGAGPLAADSRGGVWVFAHFRLEASQPKAGLFHYDRALTLVEKFEITEIGRPPVYEGSAAPPYVPPPGELYGLVADADDRLWILGRFRSELRILGRSVKSQAARGDWFLAVTRAGNAESLLLLPDFDAHLQPSGEGVISTQRTNQGGCRVDLLSSLSAP